ASVRPAVWPPSARRFRRLAWRGFALRTSASPRCPRTTGSKDDRDKKFRAPARNVSSSRPLSARQRWERSRSMSSVDTNVQLLEALPVAIYMTDAEGRITYYNQAAADLWGHRPEFGKDRWCGSWRLYWPDGRPLPHDECPMAVALKTGRSVRGVEAILERPDG